MTTATIIEQALADGVTLSLTTTGTIKVTGNGDAVRHWQPILRENKPGIVAALLEAANDSGGLGWYCGWLVHYADRDPVETICNPAATHSEILERFPNVKAAEPILERTGRNATIAEAVELRVLIESVLADTPHEWGEVHQIACADPDAAMTCWQALATAMTAVPPIAFPDLPTCQQCRNLAGNGRCLAAARCELPYVASKRYEPVQDIGRRCEAFAPKPGDPDQRSGRDRWPKLTPKGPTHG